MSNLNWWKTTCAGLLLYAAITIPLPAQILTVLHSFDYTDGSGPDATLVQAADGNLYGTTFSGGEGFGTIFRIAPNGTLTTVYNFCSKTSCTDGDFTYAGLVQATSGNFYGATTNGGTSPGGTVYKITPGGVLTTLYNFCSQSGCTDGSTPTASLVQARDGNFYGTTNTGGDYGGGTVFRITPSGHLSTLYNFCSQSGCVDGNEPFVPLVLAADGELYGTTSAGGANGQGTVFKISTAGTLTTLYNFCSQTGCLDGAVGNGLIQAKDGNFYGTTAVGGASSDCTGGCGVVFKITSKGAFTELHSFCSQPDCTDGELPFSALVQDTNGRLYGTAGAGGYSGGACSFATGCGTVFSLSIGLGPFVTPAPRFGKAETSIIILGTQLSGTTSVSFNGLRATFTVESATAITAAIPSGATTGPIQVVTPGGTLTSNVSFQVLP